MERQPARFGKGVYAQVKHAAHIGMRDLPGCLDLPMKAAQAAGHPQGPSEYLESDAFFEQRVSGTVHLAHASSAQQLFDFIAVGDDRSREERANQATYRIAEEVAELFVFTQQLGYFRDKFRIVLANVGDKTRATLRISFK